MLLGTLILNFDSVEIEADSIQNPRSEQDERRRELEKMKIMLS